MSFVREDQNARRTVIDLRMNREGIGDYLGLSTETVCRIFSEWRRLGIVEIPGRRRLVLTSPRRLQALMSSGSA